MSAGGQAMRELRGVLRLPTERLDAVVFALDGVLADAGTANAGTLAAARLDGWFTIVVDGRDADRRGLAVAPDSAPLLYAAQLLRVHPARCAVVEATRAGALAACLGGFGLVAAVDRHGGRESALRTHGANEVRPADAVC